MLIKYTDTEVTFSEVPSMICLCVDLSNCPCACVGCNSPWLAEDIGTPLDTDELHKLIEANKGVDCVVFLGGDADPAEVNRLAEYVHEEEHLKTCWYSGRAELSDKIGLWNFDYIKLGPYMEECGPLNKQTTNQKFYEVTKVVLTRNNLGHKTYGYGLKDITWKFWKDYTPTPEQLSGEPVFRDSSEEVRAYLNADEPEIADIFNFTDYRNTFTE